MGNFKFITPILVYFDEQYCPNYDDKNFNIRRITPEELRKYFSIENVKFENQQIKSCKGMVPKNSIWSDFLSLPFYKDLSENYIPYWVIESNDILLTQTLLLIFRTHIEIDSRHAGIFAPITLSKNESSFAFNYPVSAVNVDSVCKISKKSHKSIYKIIQKIGFDHYNHIKHDILNRCFDTNLAPESRFLDAVIILEMVLIEKDGPKSWAFKQYGKILCNYTNLTYTEKDLKDIYSARSEFVHAGKSKKFNETLFQICMKLMQEAVKYEILNEKWLKTVNKEILNIGINHKL